MVEETFRGQPAVRLAAGPGDSILVALHGGHLLSWTSGGQERFYLSSKAVFDGRNIYDPAEVAAAGLSYEGIGRVSRKAA